MAVKTEPMVIDGVTYFTKIAKIESTFLGIEDHGILSFFVYLDYQNGGFQGAGGFALDGYGGQGKPRVGAKNMGPLIRGILEIAGTDEWEKLTGKWIVALLDKDGLSGSIRGLATMGSDKHIIFEDILKEE